MAFSSSTHVTTATHCHCGVSFDRSDHCSFCGCEQYERVCDSMAPRWYFWDGDGAFNVVSAANVFDAAREFEQVFGFDVKVAAVTYAC